MKAPDFNKGNPNMFHSKEWEYLCEPFQMAPHVYYVGTQYVGCYLLDTGEGLILIDQAFAESVYLIFESIRKLGFDPRDIQMLLVSHGHFDHCGGTRLIQEYTGARVYMSKEDNDMKNNNPFWTHYNYENWIDFNVDEFYSDEKPIKLGRFTIQTVHTPGHTPGTTSFFFDVTDKEGNVFKCGIHGVVGVNTLNKKWFEENPKWPQSLLTDFINSLEKLKKIKVDIALPSHPNQIPILDKVEQITSDYNPFVNPAEWTNLINKRLEMAKENLKEIG